MSSLISRSIIPTSRNALGSSVISLPLLLRLADNAHHVIVHRRVAGLRLLVVHVIVAPVSAVPCCRSTSHAPRIEVLAKFVPSNLILDLWTTHKLLIRNVMTQSFFI